MLENLKKLQKPIFCIAVIICAAMIFLMDFAIIFITVDGETFFEQPFNLYELAFEESNTVIEDSKAWILSATGVEENLKSAVPAKVFLQYWLVAICLSFLPEIIRLVKKYWIKKEIKLTARVAERLKLLNNLCFLSQIVVFIIIGIMMLFISIAGNSNVVNALNMEIKFGVNPGNGVFAIFILALLATVCANYILKREEREEEKRIEERVIKKLYGDSGENK